MDVGLRSGSEMDTEVFIIRYLQCVVESTQGYLSRDAKLYFISAKSFISLMKYDYESILRLDAHYRPPHPKTDLEYLHNLCEKIRKRHPHAGAGHVHPEALLVTLSFAGLESEEGPV